MYTIGEFAAAGRVSARMLRHYDAIGLLTPAVVDAHTGYRHYSNDQLQKLLRIVELRDLGVGLEAIGQVLGAPEQDDAMIATLTTRRAELTAGIDADTARLNRIDERLRILEGTITMSIEITYKHVDPLTVYAVTGNAPGMGPENIGPVIGPLIGALDSALESAGRPLIEPSTFVYSSVEGSDEVAVTISYNAEPEPVPGDGYDVVTLPGIELAASTLHRGDMTGIGDTWMALTDKIVEDGFRIAGPAREIYLEAEGHEPGPDWVTELIFPVERA